MQVTDFSDWYRLILSIFVSDVENGIINQTL